jgi:hypothetical protein
VTGPESSEYVGDSKTSPQEPISQRTFSLASLLLFTTLVSVVLAVFKWDLGAGVAMLLLSFPAFLRTMGIVNRKKAKGIALSLGEKILAFGRSFALVALIAGSAGGTFLAAAYPLMTAGDSGIGAMAMGAVFAVGISGLLGATLIRLFWQPKE